MPLSDCKNTIVAANQATKKAGIGKCPWDYSSHIQCTTVLGLLSYAVGVVTNHRQVPHDT